MVERLKHSQADERNRTMVKRAPNSHDTSPRNNNQMAETTLMRRPLAPLLKCTTRTQEEDETRAVLTNEGQKVSQTKHRLQHTEESNIRVTCWAESARARVQSVNRSINTRTRYASTTWRSRRRMWKRKCHSWRVAERSARR